MQPSKRSSLKEEIAQEVPTKITSQHFMFPQVCFLWETYEKMKKKNNMFPQVCFLWQTHEKMKTKKNKKKACDTWGCLMAILLILINLLPFSFSFI
jgi:hypothetical protein